MSYAPIITVTGQIEDFLGNNAANATVAVRLRNFGTDNPRVPGSCIITTPWVPVALNGTGGFSFTPIGNDVITPLNTYYEVKFAADNANTAALTIPYQFTGTGSQDLSQIIPFNQPGGSGGPSVSNLVVKNPAALQTIVGFGISVPQVQDLTAPLLPHTAGGTDLGSAALPFANIYIGGSATSNIKVTGTATAARTFTLIDANSNPVQPVSGATSHQWLTFIDSSGVQHLAQPAFSDISGTISSGQLPDGTISAVVSDTNVTGSASSGTLTLGWSGQLSLLRGGTAANLSATGGAHQVLKQTSSGGAVTVGQLAFSDLSGVAVAGQIPSLDASKIATGTIALAQGGTGVDLSATGGTTKILAQDASHVVSARDLVAGDIPSLAASKITSGQLALAQGGTGADLSATGGAHQVLKQTTVGGTVAVGQLAYSDLSGTPVLPANTTATTHQFFTAYNSSTGAFTKAQPAVADLSDGSIGTGTHVVMATTFTGSGTQAVLAVNPTLSGTTLTGTTIFAGTPVPAGAGEEDLGTALLPFGNLYVGGSATNNTHVTGTVTAARTFTLPDADSNPVQPSTAGAHQFATAISSAGVVTWTQPAFSDVSGTAAAAQYVTMVGDSGSGGTKGAVPAPGSGDSAAGKFLKANGTWAVPAGSGGGITNSAATSIVPVTADSSGNLATSPIWANSTEVRIGSTTNILANTSRLYVFGGASGCNVDIQADGATAGSDVAQVEVEGSDYATHINSIAIRYYGPTALGTFCGITAQSVGVLDFIGSTTAAGIIRTGGNFPLVLGTNDVERYRINATGESKFSSSLAITGAVNVSQVAAPSAPTIAPHGGSASTWAYKIVAYDNNNQPTTASTAGQTTTGAATLDSTHWNQVNWSEVAGASYYKVFRTTVATSPTTTGVIGTVNSGSAMTLRDNGLAGDSSSVPTANTTGEGTVPAIVLTGPLVQPLATKTASYSLTVNDRIILVNAAGATTMTLPVTGSAGQKWTIKNISTGTCTVQGASGTIEGSSTVTLNPSNSFDIVFDGTNFWIV